MSMCPVYPEGKTDRESPKLKPFGTEWDVSVFLAMEIQEETLV
jgi:hypothetical protein